MFQIWYSNHFHMKKLSFLVEFRLKSENSVHLIFTHQEMCNMRYDSLWFWTFYVDKTHHNERAFLDSYLSIQRHLQYHWFNPLHLMCTRKKLSMEIRDESKYVNLWSDFKSDTYCWSKFEIQKLIKFEETTYNFIFFIDYSLRIDLPGLPHPFLTADKQVEQPLQIYSEHVVRIWMSLLESCSKYLVSPFIIIESCTYRKLALSIVTTFSTSRV